MENLELSEVLSYSPVSNQVCDNLDFEEAILFQDAIQPTLLNCRFQVLTKQKRVVTLIGINEVNIRIYNLLKYDSTDLMTLVREGLFNLTTSNTNLLYENLDLANIIKAVDASDRPVLQFLLNYFKEERQTKPYLLVTSIALQIAANRRRYDLIQILLDAGASLDEIAFAHPLLVNLASTGNLKMVEYLLNMGANINITNPLNLVTPLMAAVRMRKVEMVKLLLDRGANTSYSQENPNNSYLYSAVVDSSIEIIKLLLDRGVNQTDLNHSLLRAVIQKDIKIVKLLINKGADVNYRDDQGHSALFYATHQAGLVLPGGYTNWRPIQPNPELYQILIEAGAN